MNLSDLQIAVLDLLVAHPDGLNGPSIKRRLGLESVPTASLRRLWHLDLVEKQDVGDDHLWYVATEKGRRIHRTCGQTVE